MEICEVENVPTSLSLVDGLSNAFHGRAHCPMTITDGVTKFAMTF
jgi:hypothetical protein